MSDSVIAQLRLDDSLVRSLACAAITPGLQSLLLFNATPEVLRLTAQITAQMLEVVTGHSITSVTLSTYEQEDDLWGNWWLGGKPETQLLEWKPGLLVNDSQPRLVIIPDLTKLSLAAARACVALMGADVAHLQRHGKQEYWAPNLFWLAGCQTQQLGMLSPHLLDRFALRLSVIVRNTTFHAYRRTPVAEQMLMLLLDHTCLKNCNWEEKLLPYLSWAYVKRASICLIQVGVVNAQHELRSEKIMAKNILVPRINEGLEAGKGKATPLAHGLDVALQTLRHVLQHGRSTVQQVSLVVITDGRGNVPLADSRAGNILSPVGIKGIEDALLVAESIRSLKDVKAVLLNPQPQEYPELPLQLAQALGAEVFPILPVEIGEG